MAGDRRKEMNLNKNHFLSLQFYYYYILRAHRVDPCLIMLIYTEILASSKAVIRRKLPTFH